MKPHGSKSYIDNVLNFEALPDNIKMTYPFLQVPKPAKSEKEYGTSTKVSHPTIKPVKLMSYIITLFTREGDFVLDPFLGS
jgi:site-specific DNA-methyltransferase (adenine-specific)